MKFIDWAYTYLNVYLKPRIKEHTYYIYKELLQNHIFPFFGNTDITKITINDVNNYFQNLLTKSNGRGSNLKPSTINLVLVFFKSIFKEAYASEVITKNPTSRLKMLPNESLPIKVLSIKDQNKLVNHCLNNIDDSRYLGIIIALYTGLRIGELLGLTWSNIDFRGKTISINQTLVKYKNDEGYHHSLTNPKTSSSKRIIPISKQLEQLLKDEKQKKLSNFVVSKDHKYCLIRSYQEFFKSTLKKLNIEYVNFHVLRHTFATRCIELGIDIKTISEIMGHKNAIITLNRYSHSSILTKRKALNQLSKSIIAK